MGSRGTGAALNALVKYNVFNIWREQNVKYVNICDTSNLNTTFSDPLNLSFMLKNNLECTIDVTQSKYSQIQNPVILENQNGIVDWYFPFEMATINAQNGQKLGLYEVPYLNIFTNVEYLKRICTQHHQFMFQYRIREDKDSNGYQNLIQRINIKQGQSPPLPKKFRYIFSIKGSILILAQVCLERI